MSEYILSCSYGKDSLACIGACEELGWKVDRIVHAEVWATDDIPADLPPMVEFKKKADKIIKDRWGIEVEHICAMRSFQKPLNVGGGTNAHMKIPSTEKFQPKWQGQGQGQGNIIQTLSATTMEDQSSMDSHLLWEHGAIHISKCLSSMQLKKVTYQDTFYRVFQKSKVEEKNGRIWGFPYQVTGAWCNSELKMPPLNFRKEKEVRWCNI